MQIDEFVEKRLVCSVDIKTGFHTRSRVASISWCLCGAMLIGGICVCFEHLSTFHSSCSVSNKLARAKWLIIFTILLPSVRTINLSARILVVTPKNDIIVDLRHRKANRRDITVLTDRSLSSSWINRESWSHHVLGTTWISIRKHVN